MSESSSSTLTLRKYVDPWDLDLREVSWRHSSDTTDCSADQVVSLSSAAGPVSTRSDFVYVPGPPKTKTGTGSGSSANSSSSSSSNSDGRTMNRPVGRYDCCRCSPKPSSAFLAPDAAERYHEPYWKPAPGYKQLPYRYAVDDHFYPVTNTAVGSSNQCCLLYNVSRPEVRRISRYNNSDVDSVTCRAAAYETSSGEYDSAAENVANTASSQFRYNTLGHVKIDYSNNWNNLDKYICRV